MLEYSTNINDKRYILGHNKNINDYRYMLVHNTKINNIGIKHCFSCINIRQVPREVLKTKAEGRGFQHLPRDLANVNALKNHVRSLLLHKNLKHLLHFALFIVLFLFRLFTSVLRTQYHRLVLVPGPGSVSKYVLDFAAIFVIDFSRRIQQFNVF